MKCLYGSDPRVALDVMLADGREKLEWWSDDNKTSGTTFFDTEDGCLFFYTKDYVIILDDVKNSYLNERVSRFMKEKKIILLSLFYIVRVIINFLK